MKPSAIPFFGSKLCSFSTAGLDCGDATRCNLWRSERSVVSTRVRREDPYLTLSDLRLHRNTHPGDIDGEALPFSGGLAYPKNMTKLLKKALEAVRRLPPDSQDQIALAMLSLSGKEGEPEEVDPAHLPAVLEGLAQAKRRQFATDAEVEAAFRRFEQ